MRGENGFLLERTKGRGERILTGQLEVYTALDYLVSGFRRIDFLFGLLHVNEVKLVKRIVQIPFF